MPSEITGGALECGHCWHLTHALTSLPPISVSVCCVCGAELREWEEARAHGPFKPTTENDDAE